MAAVILAACLLRWAGNRELRTLAGATEVPITEVRRLLPDASRLSARDPERGGRRVLNASGSVVGYVLTTSPWTDDLIGYTGPNHVLVVLDAAGVVRGASLLDSGDTPAHVEAVRSAAGFWSSFVGWNPAREAMPRPAAVAGSTLTSLGVAEAVERRLSGRAPSMRFPDPVTLDEVRGFWAAAAVLEAETPRAGWIRVRDGGGRVLGHALRTSPQAETVRGYAGPTEAVVWVGPDERTVEAVRLRRSFDTPDYVDRVREDTGFLGQLAGRTLEDWSVLDFRSSGIEGVSGATITSHAVAEGVRRRLRAALEDAAGDGGGWRLRGWVREVFLLAIVLGSGVLTAGGMQGRTWIRRVWQGLVVLGLGLGCGDLLSMALVAGWAGRGVAWETAPALVLLAAMALLVPWAAGRGWYCGQICPHGVVQEWLGRWRRKSRTWQMPASWGRVLERLPWVLLALVFLVSLTGWRVDLAGWEPFDAWTLRSSLTASVVVALLGLVASVAIPMAYCRYGCPTGALLRFLKGGWDARRWERRDAVAAVLVLAGALLLGFRELRGRAAEGSVVGRDVRLAGRAFGTGWSVRLRGEVGDATALESELAGELERVESGMSHWRDTSGTAQFNAASTTLPVEVEPELARLVGRCLEVSRASGGALDPTVGALVRAWGFGPGPAPSGVPDAAELERLRQRTGWERVIVDLESHTLRKTHPGLELDLGAILQGYAADRLAERLVARGFRKFLIDVGGELLARGTWRVAVEDPETPGRVLRTVLLKDAALATSGTYRTRRSNGGWVRSHLVDPRTGRPVEHGVRLVSVMMASAADADAWATALLVGGGAEGLARLRERGGEALVVTAGPAGARVETTAGFPAEAR